MTQPVYLLVHNQTGGSTCDIYQSDDLEQMNSVLQDISVDEALETDCFSAYFGVLITAAYVPMSFHGLKPYVIVFNPSESLDTVTDAFFEELPTTPEGVCKRIQQLIEKQDELFDDEYVGSKPDQCNITIDSIFILLGKPLELGLHVMDINDDELEVKVLDAAEAIQHGKELTKMKQRWEEV